MASSDVDHDKRRVMRIEVGGAFLIGLLLLSQVRWGVWVTLGIGRSCGP
jgi:hypothetical protein